MAAHRRRFDQPERTLSRCLHIHAATAALTASFHTKNFHFLRPALAKLLMLRAKLLRARGPPETQPPEDLGMENHNREIGRTLSCVCGLGQTHGKRIGCQISGTMLTSFRISPKTPRQKEDLREQVAKTDPRARRDRARALSVMLLWEMWMPCIGKDSGCV